MAQVISCPYCGKLTDPKLESCPHCGGPMRAKAPAAQPARSEPAPAARQTCPNCHALVQDGDIICVACGTNLLTGQKIAAGGEKPALVGRRWMPWIVLGALVVVLLLIAIIYVVYALQRDPVRQAMELALAQRDLEAINVLNSYLARHPNDTAAYMALGRLQWRLSQFPNAAASFEQAANADRKNAEAALLAVLSLASASGADARDRQIEILTRWVQASPDNQRAWYLLALERGAANDIAGEIEALKNAISLNPKDPGALQNLGVALALQRDFPGAEQQLEQALQQAGGKPGDILAAQGFVASLDGKTEVAQEKLRNAVSTETSIKNQAQTRLGLLLLAQGRFDDAESYLADAALSNKDNVSAQFFYAACLQAKGLMPEALRAFEGVAQKQGPLATEALIRVADLQLAQGNTQQAREVLDKAEAAGASGAAVYTVRGRLHAAVNEDDRAREWFQKALKADANCAAAHLESGLLYVKQQNLTEGIRELDRYLSLVGANRDGTRAADVETLISHLKQAAEKQERPGGAAGLASRRETS